MPYRKSRRTSNERRAARPKRGRGPGRQPSSGAAERRAPPKTAPLRVAARRSPPVERSAPEARLQGERPLPATRADRRAVRSAVRGAHVGNPHRPADPFGTRRLADEWNPPDDLPPPVEPPEWPPEPPVQPPPQPDDVPVEEPDEVPGDEPEEAPFRRGE